jgi:hypothetical protein
LIKNKPDCFPSKRKPNQIGEDRGWSQICPSCHFHLLCVIKSNALPASILSVLSFLFHLYCPGRVLVSQTLRHSEISVPLSSSAGKRTSGRARC